MCDYCYTDPGENLLDTLIGLYAVEQGIYEAVKTVHQATQHGA